MKHSFFVFVISFFLFSLSSFANQTKVSNPIVESFNNSFKGAAEVNWTVVNDYYKASFFLNGQYVSAFYSQDGNLAATSRNISSLQLPVALQSSFKRDYEHFWVSDLFEVNNTDGTTYYITIENADSRIVLKSVNSFEWEVYKRIAKI